MSAEDPAATGSQSFWPSLCTLKQCSPARLASMSRWSVSSPSPHSLSCISTWTLLPSLPNQLELHIQVLGMLRSQKPQLPPRWSSALQFLDPGSVIRKDKNTILEWLSHNFCFYRAQMVKIARDLMKHGKRVYWFQNSKRFFTFLWVFWMDHKAQEDSGSS